MKWIVLVLESLQDLEYLESTEGVQEILVGRQIQLKKNHVLTLVSHTKRQENWEMASNHEMMVILPQAVALLDLYSDPIIFYNLEKQLSCYERVLWCPLGNRPHPGTCK